MLAYSKLNTFNKSGENPRLDIVASLVCMMGRGLGTGSQSLKLTFYDKFVCFLDCISMYIIGENKMWMAIESEKSESLPTFTSFTEMLVNLGLVVQHDSRIVWANKYVLPNEKDRQIVMLAVENTIFHEGGHRSINNAVHGYLFIVDLITLYRNPSFKSTYVSHKWTEIITNKELDYEIRLCETLHELTKLKGTEKIKSVFDDSYYTVSGKNAFENFTKPMFVEVLTHVHKQNEIKRVLDVGCGYGDYIGVVETIIPQAFVTGIELQTTVAYETQKRFEKNGNISIVNNDIFTLEPTEAFDVILLNYVLFYFTYEKKKQLFEKLATMLSAGGSIIICQYFSKIEHVKKEMAKIRNEYTIGNRIGMYYGNIVLYANVLWNDASDAFAASVVWDEFEKTAEDCGLEITSLVNADKYYYSLFVELKKR